MKPITDDQLVDISNVLTELAEEREKLGDSKVAGEQAFYLGAIYGLSKRLGMISLEVMQEVEEFIPNEGFIPHE